MSFPLPLESAKAVGKQTIHVNAKQQQQQPSSHIADQRASQSRTVDSRFLEPPSYNEHRRASYASTFSEMSDLEYMSTTSTATNGHGTGLLARSVSHDSNVSDFSSTTAGRGRLSFRQRLRNFHHENHGAFLVLLSQAFGTGMNVSAQLLEHPGPHGPGMHPFQILFVRQLITSLACTVYAVWTGSIPHFPLGPPDRKIRLLLVCRGLAGFLGVCGIYFSLLYLPLSEATVLTFLSPIMACYLCSFVLPGETFSRQQQMAGFVSLVGVVLIARPFTLFASSSSTSPASPMGVDGGNISFINTTVSAHSVPDYSETPPTNREHLLAIGAAMIGVMGATCALTSIRAIGTRAHAFISVNYFSACSVVMSLIALIAVPGVSFRLPGNVTEWTLLFILGACGFIMQNLLTRGLAYGGPAGPSSTASVSTGARPRKDDTSKVTAEDEDVELQSGQVEPSASSSSTSPSERRRQRRRRRRSQKTTTATRTAPSGNRATSMMYCQMLFALAADKVVFGTTLGVWSWIGSGFILAGAVWVATARTTVTSTGTATGRMHVDGPRRQEHEQEQEHEHEEEEVGEAVPAEEIGLLQRDQRPPSSSSSSSSEDEEAEADDDDDDDDDDDGDGDGDDNGDASTMNTNPESVNTGASVSAST